MRRTPPRPSSPDHERASLLEVLQRLIERTYRMETGITEIGRFVIGDEGYRRLYESKDPVRTVGHASSRPRRGSGLAKPKIHAVAAAGAGARVLVRDRPGALTARLYYPDALIRNLEARPPSRGLGEANVDDFATFVEELDHLLFLAERARLDRSVSLLELELHANVTKYLVCALFLAAAGGGGFSRLGEAERLWLRWQLFEKCEFVEPEPEVRARYRDATRFARRFLDRIDAEPCAAARVTLLRRFHDAGAQEKLAAFA